LSSFALAEDAGRTKIPLMSTVQEIESAIQQLPPPELSRLVQSLDEYVENAWDERMEKYARSGKFTKFKEAIAEARSNGELLDFP